MMMMYYQIAWHACVRALTNIPLTVSREWAALQQQGNVTQNCGVRQVHVEILLYIDIVISQIPVSLAAMKSNWTSWFAQNLSKHAWTG